MSSIVLFAQNDADAGFIGSLLALGAFFWVLAIVASVFWLWMLIDVLTSKKPAAEKILWFLVVFFLHLVGALVYFFVGRSNSPGTVAAA